MNENNAAPVMDPDEIPESSFADDLRKTTEQDHTPPPPPPPAPETKFPPDPNAPGEKKEPPKKEPDEIDLLSDAEFQAWMTTEGLDMVKTFACQVIAREPDPSYFESNAANRKRFQQVTAKVFERYKTVISPYVGVIVAGSITFAPAIIKAVQIRNMKKEAGEIKPDVEKPKAAPGRPTKEQQKMREMQEELDRLRKKK